MQRKKENRKRLLGRRKKSTSIQLLTQKKSCKTLGISYFRHMHEDYYYHYMDIVKVELYNFQREKEAYLAIYFAML